MSKPIASRGWLCAFYITPMVVVAIALLVVAPRGHRGAPGRASATSSAPLPGTVTAAARSRIQASYAALPLAFEQNQGQTDSQVKYLARGNGYTLFLTASDAVFSLHSSPAAESSAVRHEPGSRAKSPAQPAQHDSTAEVRMHLAGGNSRAKVAGSEALPGTSNYFFGNDQSKWRTGVPRYARVSYQNVYPGVNMAFHGAERQLEFDFVVAAGANPAPIGFQFTGNQGLKADDSGNLIISSAAGDVLLRKPVAYQERNGARQPVDARFVLKADNHVSFELGEYDRGRELVIDPTVSYVYATYLGGLLEDDGYGIAFDSSGNAYVTGQTTSLNFPTKAGGFAGTNAGTFDVFVTQIASNGSSLGYSTYVGGTGNESGNAIAVDSSGDAFVTGNTSSTDFPHSVGAFQISLAPGSTGNAFVFELNSTGSALTYSTYLGGTGLDTAFGIALASDNSGDVVVVGKTSSTDFPPLSPLQATPAGGFVTKLNSTGTALVFSTYLGAGSSDFVNAVAVDSSDNVYMTGRASSSTFHTTPLVVQTACASCGGGFPDAFVTVINPAGSAYVYSTFLGGSGSDVGNGIAVDSSGNAYVTGTTASADFFTTTGAYQTAYGGNTDAFIVKLNPTGTTRVYSTYLGGALFDAGASIAIDAAGNAYVTGQTSSNPFPTVNPTQTAGFGGGGFDAFVSEINSSGSTLLFSTYLGGTGNEDTTGNYGAIAVDSAGANIYVTGNTTSSGSTGFPTTSGAFQTSNGGGTDAFVVKYTQPATTSASFSLSATALNPASVNPGGSATSTVTVTPTNGFSGSVTLTCAVSPVVTLGPTCSGSATTATAGTLTVSTTAAAALLQQPQTRHSSAIFYAMFLPMGGLALVGFGSAGSRRRKLLGSALLCFVLGGLLLLPACGGGGTKTPPSSGTPAGTYTITVSGTATGATQTGTPPALTLTVN